MSRRSHRHTRRSSPRPCARPTVEALEGRVTPATTPASGFTSVLLFYNLDVTDPAALDDKYKPTSTADVNSWLRVGDPVPLSTFTRNYWSDLSESRFHFNVDSLRDAARNPVIARVASPPLTGGNLDGYRLAEQLASANAERIWRDSGRREGTVTVRGVTINARIVPSIVLMHHRTTKGGQALFQWDYTVWDQASQATYVFQDMHHLAFNNDPGPSGYPHAWGTMMHEYTHNFLHGADLYAQAGGRVGTWDILGDDSSPGLMSDVSSFYKTSVEWTTYTAVVNGPVAPARTYTLRPYGTNSEAIKIVPDLVNNPREYFLVEYRKARSGASLWTADGHLTESGLLVTHVFEPALERGGLLGIAAPFMDVEESDGQDGKGHGFNWDGSQHWGRDFYDLPWWDAGDPDAVGTSRYPSNNWPGPYRPSGVLFPLDGSRSFTPTTTPSSHFYGDRPSGLAITGIRRDGNNVTFTVELRGTGATRYDFSGAERLVPFDVDGDGKDEVLIHDGARLALLAERQGQFHTVWSLARSTGSWTFSASDELHVADFTGDGRDDLLLRRADQAVLLESTGQYLSQSWSGAGWVDLWRLRSTDRLYVGDYDGDGRADLFLHGGTTAGLAFSTGIGFQGGPIFLNPGGWRLGTGDRFTVGDFDGDGRDDLFARSAAWAGLLRSTGTNFDNPWTVNGRVGAWTLGANDQHYAGDFDNDGRDDIFVRTADRAALLASRGTTFVNVWASTGGLVSDWALGGSDLVGIGDFDADGDADLYLSNPGGKAAILASFGSGFSRVWQTDDNGGGPVHARTVSQVVVGHFNHDLHADLFTFHRTGGASRKGLAEVLYPVRVIDNSGDFPGLVIGGEWGWRREDNLLARPLGALPDRHLLGDFIGDDRTDVLAWNGRGLALYANYHGHLERVWQSGTTVGSWYLGADNRITVGDYDGDGRDDLFVRSRTGGAALLRASGNGFVNVWQTATAVGSWALGPRDLELAGDFTGDGRDDIFIRSPGYAGLLTWTGTGFRASSVVSGRVSGVGGSWSLAAHDQHLVGDFNGDGRDDIFIRSPGYAGLLTGTGSGFTAAWVGASRVGTWTMGPGDRYLVGDFDGNGDAELYVHGRSGAATLNWSGSSFATTWTTGNALGSWALGAADREVVGDFDHDGRDDILAIHPPAATAPWKLGLLTSGSSLGAGLSLASRMDWTFSTWPLNAHDGWQTGRFYHADRDEMFVSHPGGATGIFRSEGDDTWAYNLRTQAHYRELTASPALNPTGQTTGGGLVAGTNAHDVITLRPYSDFGVDVEVRSYSDSNFTNLLATVRTTVASRDGIVINAGAGNDTIVIVGDVKARVLVRGMDGSDRLEVDGRGTLTGSFYPAVEFERGKLQVGSQTTVDYEGFEVDSRVTASRFAAFTYRTPGSKDRIGVIPADGFGEPNRLQGVSDLLDIVPFAFVEIADLTIDAATNDRSGSPDADDSVVVRFTLAETTPLRFTVQTGAGNDLVEVLTTTAGSETIVDTGADNDTIKVGSAASRLAQVRGTVTVQAGAGTADTLNLRDAGSSSPHTYTLTASTFQRDDAGRVSYSRVETLTLDTGSQADRIVIEGTGAATTIQAGDGDDIFEVTPTDRNLERLLASLVLDGGGHTNRVTINDANNPYGFGTLNGLYTLAAGGVSRLGQRVGVSTPVTVGLGFRSVSEVTLDTGGQADVITVASTPGPTTVRSGGGADVMDVHLAGLGGPLTVIGGDLGDTLALRDTASPVGRSYALAYSLDHGRFGLARDAQVAVLYDTIEILDVTLSPFADTLNVSSTQPGLAITARGGDGLDVITGGNAVNYFFVTAVDAGTHSGTGSPVAFSSFENLLGSGGTDVFVFGNVQWVSGGVDGGDGIDTLDFSAWTIPVRTNLRDRRSVGVIGEVRGIENVLGGAAADTLIGDDQANLLVGGGDDDTLDGSGGRDLLIGGLGADLLLGGEEEDLLIGGTTSYDLDARRLSSLLSEWAAPAADYATRVTALRASLTSASVFDDAVRDTLTGSGGHDWFWAGPIDELDQNPMEEKLN